MRRLGIVLAGGGSRRLGSDKAFVEVGGQPLVARVAGRLRAAGVDPVIAVGRDRSQVDELGHLGLPAVADRWPGEGPAGGMVCGLGALEPEPGDVVVVAGCDLPELAPTLVAGLADACTRAEGVAAAIVPSWRGHRQFHLFAVRGPGLASATEEAFAAGARSLHATLAGAGVVVGELPVADDDESLADVDTADDLARARRRHRH